MGWSSKSPFGTIRSPLAEATEISSSKSRWAPNRWISGEDRLVSLFGIGIHFQACILGLFCLPTSKVIISKLLPLSMIRSKDLCHDARVDDVPLGFDFHGRPA